MTATHSVLSALATSGLPLEGQSFVAAVVEGETPQNEGPGYSPWNILYSGAGALMGTAGLVNPADAANILMVGNYRYWTGPLTTFPQWGGGKLANGNLSTAAGGPEITRTTWIDNAGFGITAFDPVSQSIFAWKLAQQRFAAHTSRALLDVLKGTESDRMLVSAYLVATWPGGCDANFPKRFTANLAALQAWTNPPVPPPTMPPPASQQYKITLADSSGRTDTQTFMLKSPAGAMLVALGVAVAGMIGAAIAHGPQQNAKALLPENEVVLHRAISGLDKATAPVIYAGASIPPICSKDLRQMLNHIRCATLTESGR